jgi:hypothetical protein
MASSIHERLVLLLAQLGDRAVFADFHRAPLRVMDRKNVTDRCVAILAVAVQTAEVIAEAEVFPPGFRHDLAMLLCVTASA